MAYSSSFLAYGTVLNPGPNCDEYEVAGGFHTINFSDLYYTPIPTTTISKSGCPALINPRVSLPAELTEVAPSWATCEPLFYGAYDPPTFLTKASQMAPIQMSGGSVTANGPAAATYVPATAEATPTPALPQPTVIAKPLQNSHENAAAQSHVDQANTLPTQISPPTGNAAYDPQKAPANPVAAPSKGSQEAAVYQGEAPPSEPQGAPVDPAVALGTNQASPAAPAGNDAPNRQVSHAQAPDSQAHSQAVSNAVNKDNQVAAPANAAQPQGFPYSPQEGGFDPATIRFIQSALAALVTPENQQGNQDIRNQQNPSNQPHSNSQPDFIQTLDQPSNITPLETHQTDPVQPGNSNSSSGEGKSPQSEPVPLVIGPNGGVLVDNGSHDSQAVEIASILPAATAAATISADNSGNLYAVNVQPAKDNAPAPVSVAGEDKIYDAQLSAGYSIRTIYLGRE
ncbi:hypothetical protein P7C71_g1266, partial [Lecanoromycetidae sp. Uapishka_2]